MLPDTLKHSFTSRDGVRTRPRFSASHIILILITGLLLPACSQTATTVVKPDTDEVLGYLAVIDGTSLEFDEFRSQFNRTALLASSRPSDSLAEYQDFLERYVAFKLKVLEARSAGYAESPEMKSELIQYRGQLARPYLLQNEVTDPLIREFYERRQVMVSASHILLRVTANGSPADTLEAFRKLSSISDSVSQGIDFGDLAFRNSDDPSASREPDSPGYRGYLGFFGGGKMVYNFENAVYGTDPGKVSTVFRTQFGYHIVFVHERRPFPDDRRIAHIIIRPAGNSPADSIAARLQIQDIRDELESGGDFAVLASDHSSDTVTAPNGGELQRINYDSGLPQTMRDAAFNLDVDTISEIVESPFGYHIIKLLEIYPKKTLKESEEEIQAKLVRLPRTKNAEQQWKERIRNESGSRIDSLYLSDWSSQFSAPVDSTATEIEESMMKQPVVWLGDSTYTMRHFTTYLEELPSTISRTNVNDVLRAANQFVLEMVVEQEILRLETRDDEFARTMAEFADGLLLFRLMEDSVWTAAANDSLGLLAYYNQHTESYRFEDRTRVISFTTRDESAVSQLVSEIRALGYAEPVVKAIQDDSTSVIRVDTTLIEAATNSVYDRGQEISWDAITDPVPYNSGFIALYNDGPDPARMRTYEESKALVVNGYQDVLEKRLLDRLYIKYSVRVYPENLELLLSDD